MDARVFADQSLHERMKQRFISFSGIVNTLEETEVKGEFLLGNTPMGAKPTPRSCTCRLRRNQLDQSGYFCPTPEKG